MATDLAAGTAEDTVRVSLLVLSRRLEAEWRTAVERLRHSPPQSAERNQWATATSRLIEALDRLERYARGLDPTLGRRDWTARTHQPRDSRADEHQSRP